MQCKDIPTLPILDFLRIHGGIGCTWFSADPAESSFHDRSVRNAMPAGTCGKLVHAKMRALIAKGLVDGCPCGCRGDFEITAKGEQTLNPQTT